MRCFTKYIIIALCLLLSALPLNACPMCKEAVAEITGMAKGFSLSVLLMLAVPIVVVAVISSIVAKAYRKAANASHLP